MTEPTNSTAAAYLRRRQTLLARVPPKLKPLCRPDILQGEDIDLLPQHCNLHLSEVGMALGVNTSALYSKKSAASRVNSSVSLLLRLYASFSHMIPRITPPDAETFLEKIRLVEPGFAKYSLGPLVGIEANSSYRLIEKNFVGASQTTRVLVWLIDKILDEDPNNWALIKAAVEVEAEARNIMPPSSVWKSGGWQRNKSLKNAKTPGKKTDALSNENTTTTLKKPVRRRELPQR